MPTRIRMEWNHDEFQRILNSPEVTERLKDMGACVVDAAGDGFEAKTVYLNYGGSPRQAVVVSAETWAARRAEAKDKVLSRALSAASGG